MDPLAQLLARLPDLPRWLELRSALLAGEPSVLHGTPEDGVIAVGTEPEGHDLYVVGRPPLEVLARALRAAPEADLVVVGDREHVARLLGYAGTHVTISRLASDALFAISSEQVDFLGPADVGRLAHLDEELQDELMAALRRVPVAAVVQEGLPVAFCYAGSVSETLWDVSIDTHEPYRRRGFAAQAAAAMAWVMRQRGREPVWCAAADNPASGRLAEKLGFVGVDAMWVYPPTEARAIRQGAAPPSCTD